MRLFLTPILLLIGLLAALSAYRFNAVSGSVDLAWHYTLTRYLSDTFWFPHLTERSLGPMYDYPFASHLAAAVLSRLSGMHELVAMNVVSTTAVFAVFGGLIFLLSGPYRLAAAAMAAVGLGVFAYFDMRASTGAELLPNYFFAQLAGDAALVLAVVVVSRMRADRSMLVAAPLLALAVGSVFNLAAVKFTIVLFVFQAVRFLGEPEWSAKSLMKRMLPVFLAGLATIAHPHFWGMVANANHDGGLAMPLPLVALAGVTTLASGIYLATRSANDRLNLSLGSLAAGVSIALFLQWAALWLLGLGSEYAVKKHTFLVTSVGAFALGSIIAQAARMRARDYGLADAFPVLFVYVALGAPGSSIVPAAHYLTEINRIARERPEVIDNSLSMNRDLLPAVNFAAGLGDLGMGGWTARSLEQLGRWGILSEFDLLAEFAFVDPAQAEAMLPGCLVVAADIARLVRAECLPPPG